MARDENNFYCPETKKEFYIPTYRTMFQGGEKIYKDKFNKQLVNPDNGVVLLPIEKKVDWSEGTGPMIGTGTGKSGIAKRNAQLAQRSKNHYKKEISESRYEKNKALVNKFKNGE